MSTTAPLSSKGCWISTKSKSAKYERYSGGSKGGPIEGKALLAEGVLALYTTLSREGLEMTYEISPLLVPASITTPAKGKPLLSIKVIGSPVVTSVTSSPRWKGSDWVRVGINLRTQISIVENITGRELTSEYTDYVESRSTYLEPTTPAKKWKVAKRRISREFGIKLPESFGTSDTWVP